MRIALAMPLAALLVLMCETALPQTSRIQRAHALFEAGGYYEAIELFKRDLDKVPREQMGLILQRVADSYRRIGNARQAEIWYGKAIQRNAPDPRVHYYYAEMLKMGEKYEEALAQYKRYLQLAPNDPLAQAGIESCELAMQWKETPSGYQVAPVRALNSRQSDFSPSFASGDYGALLFTSSREEALGTRNHAGTGEKFTDIFMSERNRQGVWSRPLPLDEAINSEYDEGTPALSADFNTLYFTRCRTSRRQKLGCEIFTSQRREEGWSSPEALPIAADSMVVAHPSISADDLTLYFASNIPGGAGGIDLWRVTRTSPGDTWGEPVNLGPQINSPGREMFPFIHPDGTLYFASDGWPGMGGLDIFRAKPTGQGGWEVENMRYPVNSSADDFGIIFEREREAGFLTSRRRDPGTRGGDNLFAFHLPPIHFNIIGSVRDINTQAPIAGSTVKLVGSDGTISTAETAANGGFRFMLNPNTDYVLIASKEGFLNGKGKESTRGLQESRDFNTTITLTSTARPIELANIFFDFDRWELRPESMAALDHLIEVLRDNPTIIIELGAHTDSRGSLEYNHDLSQRRAQSVVNYLIQNGVPPARLRARGYAQTQPKVVDPAIAAQHPFLPLGATLNQAFINGLNSEEQRETVHQINRRTEFRVLSTEYVPGG